MNTTVDENELSMAKSLIQGMTKPFNPDNLKNEYQERLKTLITEKISGNEIVTQQPAEQQNIINLVDALQASLQSVADQQTPKSVGRKKKVTEKA